MRGLLAAGLALTLALWIAGARGDEVTSPSACPYPIQTQPARRPTTDLPVVTLGRPVVTLGRPVALPPEAIGRAVSAPVNDRLVRPVSFSFPALDRPRPLARAQSADTPKPLPPGDLEESGGPVPGDSPPPPKPATPKPGPHPLVPVPAGSTAHSSPVGGDDCCSPSTCCPAPTCCPADGSEGCCDSCGGSDCCWAPFWWLRPANWTPLWRFSEANNGPYRFWASGEYLLWWIKDSPMPPLVTTSPPGTARQMAGVLGTDSTGVLFGGTSVSNEERSGGRFTVGLWFDDCQALGLEGSFLFLGERSVSFAAGSAGLPILARPFFDVLAGQQASELVAFPGVVAGNIAVNSSSRLWGAELNLRSNLCRGCWWRLDALGGFRYFGLDESLTIGENLMVPGGAGITVLDQFGTHNNFYGGQLGIEAEFQRGRWFLDLLGKVALGGTHETINIEGNTNFAVPGRPVSVQPGGLLALPSNIGHFNRDRFAVLPEAGVKVGYQVTDHLRAFVGYSFIYLSDVARPGHQIDRGVNVSQLPSQVGPGTLAGPARPAPTLAGTDFWAQGINFGLEFRY